MASPQWLPHVVPAQLSFLAIYNPSLGPSEETFSEQLVFWYSRSAHEVRAAARKGVRDEQAVSGRVGREEENEKLRQIGLAQGMVDFAKSFSEGKPVDSIETEKSRVVLRELESGWWVLASIDLTQLPSPHPPSQVPPPPKRGTENVEPRASVEYSSREVSPPALLIQQLLQAHYIFLLHHGPSLSELYVRFTRAKFCATLGRFWTRFCRTWDVLLHGNPAADIFSGLKLASGGELGFGVGEEEWGSGEREVLEDMVRRTDGLVDVVVSRFGDPADDGVLDNPALHENEALPWMGSGSQPTAADGVIFGGVGAVVRPSLKSVSLWMRQIYTYGDYAYGVRDNPLRERRKRRRRNPLTEPTKKANGSAATTSPVDENLQKPRQQVQQQEAVTQLEDPEDRVDPTLLPCDPRVQIHDMTASQDHAVEETEHTPQLAEVNRPGIPPPIVSAVDDALARATKDAEQGGERAGGAKTDDDGSGSTLGIPDQYMKYLTFGLSELRKSDKSKPALDTKHSASTSSEAPVQSSKQKREDRRKYVTSSAAAKSADEKSLGLNHVDPKADGDDVNANITIQQRRENTGHFVIGLKGDLDALPADSDGNEDAANLTEGSSHTDSGGNRTVLRTLQVEIDPKSDERTISSEHSLSKQHLASGTEPVNETTKNMSKVRVLVYVRRPFIYCFLFENRTSSLQWSGLYQQLHRDLKAIHKPLLSSTSARKVVQRIEASHIGVSAEQDAASARSSGWNKVAEKGGATASEERPIMDLIYDPSLLTVHTSIPNIPEPGTSAAEGLGHKEDSPTGWNRVEALNVHSAILNTLESVKHSTKAVERTSKTSRGWWVVWMKVSPSWTYGPAVAAAQRAKTEGQVGDVSSAATLHGENVQSHGENGSSTATLHGDAHAGPDVEKGDGGGADHLVKCAKMLPDSSPNTQGTYYRTAFLVRKSSPGTSTATKAPSSSRRAVSHGLWSSLAALRPSASTDEVTGGASAGWGPGALAGGIGFDARKYIEGLMSLNR